MPTDEERQEVARKLRAGAEYLPNDMYSDDLELELAKTVCRYDTPSVDVLFNRLADLIEPTPKCSEPTPKCNRDALLALADEMDSASEDGLLVRDSDLMAWTDRIREALGVEDAGNRC